MPNSCPLKMYWLAIRSAPELELYISNPGLIPVYTIFAFTHGPLLTQVLAALSIVHPESMCYHCAAYTNCWKSVTRFCSQMIIIIATCVEVSTWSRILALSRHAWLSHGGHFSRSFGPSMFDEVKDSLPLHDS